MYNWLIDGVSFALIVLGFMIDYSIPSSFLVSNHICSTRCGNIINRLMLSLHVSEYTYGAINSNCISFSRLYKRSRLESPFRSAFEWRSMATTRTISFSEHLLSPRNDNLYLLNWPSSWPISSYCEFHWPPANFMDRRWRNREFVKRLIFHLNSFWLFRRFFYKEYF